jgi:hypothetical protein
MSRNREYYKTDTYIRERSRNLEISWDSLPASGTNTLYFINIYFQRSQ